MDEELESDLHLSGLEAPRPERQTISEALEKPRTSATPAPAVSAPPEKLPPLLLKKPGINKKILFIGAGVLLFVALLVTAGGKKKQTPAPRPQSSASSLDLSRYQDDPDGDHIPSFIEQKMISQGYNFDPTVSELDRCFNTKCDSVNTEEIKRIPRNVMLLLDSSGSMKEKVGGQTKMESAKIAIKEYLKKTSELPNTKVGLVVYGHKGSNAEADKAESCSSAETKVPLGKLDLASADSALADAQPVGWTPIGLALREAGKNFDELEKSYDKENPRPEKIINEVVIISDGVETCDTNPLQAAKDLFGSKNNVIVHVIGFAVDGVANNKALRDISQAAGGTYATAPTIDELKLAMDLQWDNYVRRAREDSCRTKGFANFSACKDYALSHVISYTNAELSRDPKELPYDEKLKIDRIRYVFPAYINGTLDPFAPSPEPASTSPASPSPSPSPSASPQSQV